MSRKRAYSLTFDIVHQLGEEVVSGKYSKDTAFPTEAELGIEYDVSRSVIREAVKMLTVKGLLSARPRRGTIVTKESEWDLLDQDILQWLLKREVSIPLMIDFTHTRLAIEPQAAFLAATNITDAQRITLIKAVKEMEQATSGELSPLETDIAFHLAVLAASNNRFFVLMDSFVETALRFSIRTSNKIQDVNIGSVEEHKVVADAILAGRPELAKKGMEKMLVDVLQIFKQAE